MKTKTVCTTLAKFGCEEERGVCSIEGRGNFLLLENDRD